MHARACLMLKLFSHVHVLGVRDNGHPYLIKTRSQNSCLLSMYSSSLIGKVDSHVEAPYSVLISFCLYCWLVYLNLCRLVSVDYTLVNPVLFSSWCCLYFNLESRKSFLVVLLTIHALLLVVKSFEIQCLQFQKKNVYPVPQVYLIVIIEIVHHFRKSCFLWWMV